LKFKVFFFACRKVGNQQNPRPAQHQLETQPLVGAGLPAIASAATPSNHQT